MFAYRSVQSYHHDLHAGRVTCVDAVRFYLDNIERNRHLNAFVRVYAEDALQQAAEADLRLQQGHAVRALEGVVVGVKDVLSVAGKPVSASSRILDGYISPFHATAVDRLVQAGAIVIGHLNCDEFAMGSSNEHSAFGPVLNARNNEYVPGGSSGGSAVAVQANLCMLSLGTDTGGSVRQPADFCGVIGLKPSYGRISRYGLIAYASSFDQVGIFGTDIEDIELVLQVMEGPDGLDGTVATIENVDFQSIAKSDRPLKIAYLREGLNHPSLDGEIREALLAFFDILRKDGHQVQEVDFDYLDYIVPAYYVLTTAEASSNLSRFDGVRYGYRSNEPVSDVVDMYKKSRSKGFGAEVKRRILLGTFVLSAGYYDAYFTKAQQVRRLVLERTRTILASYDAIVLPTAPGTAFKFGEKTEDPIAMYLADIYTVYANLVGFPAISLPMFEHSNGMPFGLQVMTDKFQESTLLEISRRFLEPYGKKLENNT